MSLYFHIPFCLRRCGYCDFNTFAGMQTYIPAYVKSLCVEVESVLARSLEPVNAHTIYFGGGTPSLLGKKDFAKILKTIRKHATIADLAETSLEANPETVTSDYLQELREIGFNRISFGMQSAAAQDLRILDRQHNNESLLKAVEWSRQAGFENINLDLIFGIPRQSLRSWQETLKLALCLGVEHFSIYSLILEEGTRLKAWVDRGQVEQPDEDLAGDMYELALEMLEATGYSQYEISNWSINRDKVCRHNLQYWRYRSYLGFGAGAHGFTAGMRTENVNLIPEYLELIAQERASDFPAGPACKQTLRLNKWEQIQEHMMVSLRLTQEGVSIGEFKERYGIDILDLFALQITRLQHQGLLDFFNGEQGLRLTRKGRLFGNRVFAAFIGNRLPCGYEYLAS